MFKRFTKGAREVVTEAQNEARLLGHTHIGTEHLLLALTRPGAGMAASVLAGLGVTHEDAVSVIIEEVGRGPGELGPGDAEALRQIGIDLDDVRWKVERAFGRGALEPKSRDRGRHIPFTPNAKKALELSLRESLALEHKYIGAEHILLGLIRCDGSTALRLLRRLDAAPKTIRNRVENELRRAS